MTLREFLELDESRCARFQLKSGRILEKKDLERYLNHCVKIDEIEYDDCDDRGGSICWSVTWCIIED